MLESNLYDTTSQIQLTSLYTIPFSRRISRTINCLAPYKRKISQHRYVRRNKLEPCIEQKDKLKHEMENKQKLKNDVLSSLEPAKISTIVVIVLIIISAKKSLSTHCKIGNSAPTAMANNFASAPVYHRPEPKVNISHQRKRVTHITSNISSCIPKTYCFG